MPRGDGTGPAGLGPMTGKGMGGCAGFGVPGYGFYGRGGRGRNCRYFQGGLGRGGAWAEMPVGGISAKAVSREGEVEMLKRRGDILKQQLADIQARIDAVTSQDK